MPARKSVGLESPTYFACPNRARGQVEGPVRLCPSRGRAFRTRSPIADIPIKARTPLVGSGTEATVVTEALSA